MRIKKPAKAGRRSGVRVLTNIRKHPDGTDVFGDYFETTVEDTTVLGTESELQDTSLSYNINYTGVSLEPDTSNTNQYSLMTIKSPLRNPSSGKSLRGRKAGRPRKKSRSQKKRLTAFPNSDSELLSQEKTYVDKSVITSPASFTRASLALSRVGLNHSTDHLHLRSTYMNSPFTSIPEKVEFLNPRSVSESRIGVEDLETSRILSSDKSSIPFSKSLSEEPFQLQHHDRKSSESYQIKATISNSPTKSSFRQADKESPYKLVEKLSSLTHQIISKSSPGLENLESSKIGITVTPSSKSLSNVELKNTEDDKDISQKKPFGSISPAKALPSKLENKKSANKSVEKSASLTPKNTVSPAKTLSSKQRRSANKSVEKSATLTPKNTVSSAKIVSSKQRKSANKSVEKSTSLTPKNTVSPAKILSSKRRKSANKSVEKSTSLTPKNTVSPAKILSSKQRKSADKSVEKSTSLTTKNTVSPAKILSSKRKKSADKSVDKSTSLTPKNTVSPAKVLSSKRRKSANKSVEKSTSLTPKNAVSPAKILSSKRRKSANKSVEKSAYFTPKNTLSPVKTLSSKKRKSANKSVEKAASPTPTNISKSVTDLENLESSRTLRSNRVYTPTSKSLTDKNISKSSFQNSKKNLKSTVSPAKDANPKYRDISIVGNELEESITSLSLSNRISTTEMRNDNSSYTKFKGINEQTSDDVSQMQIVTANKTLNTPKSMLHSHRNICGDDQHSSNSEDLVQNVTGKDGRNSKVLEESPSQVKRKRRSSSRLRESVDKRASDDNVEPSKRLSEASSQRKDCLSQAGTSGHNTSNRLTKKRGRKRGKSKDWNKTPSPTPYVRERPKRNRIPPLAYWKGERRTFRYTKEGEIVLIETNLVNDPTMRKPPKGKKPKAKKRKREDDVLSDQEQLLYHDEASGSEIELLTVFEKLDWEMEKSSKSNTSYKIGRLELPQKHTTGYLEFEINGSKEEQYSPVSNLQFVVLEGIIEFTVAGNSVKLGRRDSLFIPYKIPYSIKNCFERKSVLFFTSFLND